MALEPKNTCPECLELVPNCCCFPAAGVDNCIIPSTWYDDRLLGLARKKQLFLLGACHNGIYRLVGDTEGSVYVDTCGVASVSQEGHDLRELITYLRDENGTIITDPMTGLPVPSGLQNWAYLMVLIATVDNKTGQTFYRWRKVRGVPDSPAYVHWDGEQFSMAGPWDGGLCTKTALDQLTEVYLAGSDPAELSGETCLGRLVSTRNDLLMITAAGITKPLNPSGAVGVVFFGASGPVVTDLCELGTDECGDQSPPTKLFGCAGGEPTATRFPEEDLPDQACAWGVTYCPDQVGDNGFKPAPFGRTFWPAEAELLDQSVDQSGNISGTLTAFTLAAATGQPVPDYATHARVRVQMTLTTDEQEVLKSGTMSVGGILLASPLVQHYAATGSNSVRVMGHGTVPLSAGSLPFALSGDPDSTFQYKIWLEGYEVCPCSIYQCP